MICFNCKSQIPDNVTSCPNCGAPVMYQAQVKKEVKFRRWQRWVLYAVIAIVFIGMTAYAVKIYLDNATLMNRVAAVTQNLEKSRQDLQGTQKTLTDRESQLAQSQSEINQYQGQVTDAQNQITQLTESQKALTQKTEEYQATINTQAQSLQGYQQFRNDLGADNANIFNTLVQLGVGTSNKDLSKIMVADWNLNNSTDTDKDGLSDVVEVSLGTDPTKADTDGDKFSDKDEILKGYNPLGAGKLPLSESFAKMNSGKILIQIEGKKEAWYVNPKDLKRYFLGLPGDAVKAMQALQKIQTQ